MCISVHVQVVRKKEKAKGIAEQVRGQNLPGLVLVLFLPKPMEGVIVLRHFETFWDIDLFDLFLCMFLFIIS